MNEYVEIEIDAPLPDYLKSRTKCWKRCPLPGVDIVLATDKYFVEINKSSINRTLELPSDGLPIQEIDTLHSEKGWFYVLTGDECVFLVSGDNFQLSHVYENIDFAGVQDYLGIQQPLLFLQPSDGDCILTDGLKKFDVNQMWPPDQEKQEVLQKLTKRMKVASSEISDQERELVALKSFVDSAARSLADSYVHNNTIKEDSLQSVLNSENCDSAKENIIQIVDRHIKLCEDVIVITLEFNSRISLTNLRVENVCQEPVSVTSKSDVVVFREDGSMTYPDVTSHLDPGQRGFCLVQVSSSLVTLSRSQQRNFLLAVAADQGRSKAESVILNTDTLFTPPSSLSLISPSSPSSSSLSASSSSASDCSTKSTNATSKTIREANTEFVIQLLTFYSKSVEENLDIKSNLGKLDDFSSIVQKIGFVKSPNRLGHHCWLAGHPLYGSLVLHTARSQHHLTVRLSALSYSVLGVIVKLLRGHLPCDATISLSQSHQFV